MYQITFSGSPQGASPVVHKRSGQIQFFFRNDVLMVEFGGKDDVIYKFAEGLRQWLKCDSNGIVPMARVGYTEILIEQIQEEVIL